MKEILKKYSVKSNLKEEEGKAVDLTKVEKQARKLHGDLQSFFELTSNINIAGDQLKKALAYLKQAYRYVPAFTTLSMSENVEVGADDLTKMSDREEKKVADMANDMDGNVKVVKEESHKEDRYLAKASFYVYVNQNENPEEKALELLDLIDQNHDGASPRLIGDVEKVSQGHMKYETVKTFSKKDFLNEIAVRKKGYQYSKTLDKKAFLNEIKEKA